MALKGDRFEGATDISFFMGATAERGGIACLYTAGSGVALDQAAAEARYVATPSGYAPLGVLLNDVVNLDLTRQHINRHKNEMQLGSKVTLMQEGFIVTNLIYPGITPLAGQLAYVGYSGYFSNVALSDDSGMGSNRPIGRFHSTVDEDGYYKVHVNMPA